MARVTEPGGEFGTRKGAMSSAWGSSTLLIWGILQSVLCSPSQTSVCWWLLPPSASHPLSLWGSFGGLHCCQLLLLCLQFNTQRQRVHLRGHWLPQGEAPTLVQWTRRGHMVHSRETGLEYSSEVAGPEQMSQCF